MAQGIIGIVGTGHGMRIGRIRACRQGCRVDAELSQEGKKTHKSEGCTIGAVEATPCRPPDGTPTRVPPQTIGAYLFVNPSHFDFVGKPIMFGKLCE